MESHHDPTTAQYVTQSDYILGPGGEQMSEYQMQPGRTMAWQHTNVWVAGRLLATYEQNTTTVNGVTTPGSLLHFYLDDPLGTRRVQADYAGNLEQTCSSLPYGDSESCGTTPTEHLFTGKERDSESGNDYFGARYYSSAMGRFMSPDWSATAEPVPYAKLDNPQSLNLYAYVRSNPMTGVDVDGHAPLSWGGFEDCSVRGDCNGGGQTAAQQVYNMITRDVADGASVNIRYNPGQQDDGGPKDHFVSYSDWPTGAGHFHHGGIAVDSDKTKGFSTANPSTPKWERFFWPKGAMEDDIEAHTKNGETARHSYTHIPITAGQAREIQREIDNRTAHPGRYNLMFRSCALADEDFMNAGGVYGIPLGVTIPFVLHWFVLGAAHSQ